MLSDRVGRALTLRLSAAAGVLAYAFFVLAEGSFAIFAAAQVAPAVHFSFRSGTDAAWHYDLLEHEGLAHEFMAREARLKSTAFWVRAASATPALSLAVHPVLASLLLLRSVHPAIGHIVVDVAVAPRVARSERATYLSLHSLAGRIGYGAVLLGLGVLVGDASRMSGDELQLVLGSCATFAALGTLALAATRGGAERGSAIR